MSEMSPESLKSQGNACFKERRYQEACEAYSMALDRIRQGGGLEAAATEAGESNDDDDDDEASWETVSSDEREALEATGTVHPQPH